MEKRSRSQLQQTGLRFSNKGSVLIEAIIAVGLAGIVFTSSINMLLSARSVTSRTRVRQEALWVAQEGLAAIKSMSFEHLSITESGGLTFSGGHWQMDGSPDTLLGGLLRTVRVRQVSRDTSCLISAIGTVDDDTLEIESEVSWTDVAGRTQTIHATSVRTRWESPLGNCFEPTMADCFSADVSEAEWFGGKQLREVYISNTCTDDVTVSHIQITWTNAKLIQQVFFGTSKVWSSNGPGTPSGNQPSGTILDIQDEVLSDSETLELQKTQFTGAMAGTIINVIFTFTDGTTLDTGSFTPAG